ncbi:deoxyuridine 5'-triphosphate nucleotidohydrolase-like [Lissotriton helveticus]
MLTPALQIKPHVATNTILYWETAPGALAPYCATPKAAGLDLHALKLYQQHPRDITLIETGFGVQIPPEHFGLIVPRSGLALKSIQVLVGVVDADYQGEIKLILLSSGNYYLIVQPGDRVAQMVIMPVYGGNVMKGTAPALLTVRGKGGFGSTDKNPGATLWVESPNKPPEPAELIAKGKDNILVIIKTRIGKVGKFTC